MAAEINEQDPHARCCAECRASRFVTSSMEYRPTVETRKIHYHPPTGAGDVFGILCDELNRQANNPREDAE